MFFHLTRFYLTTSSFLQFHLWLSVWHSLISFTGSWTLELESLHCIPHSSSSFHSGDLLYLSCLFSFYCCCCCYSECSPSLCSPAINPFSLFPPYPLRYAFKKPSYMGYNITILYYSQLRRDIGHTHFTLPEELMFLATCYTMEWTI